MSGRIVLFGATGYTGRLTAEALAEWRTPVVLAGRDEGRLRAMADRLGGPEGGLSIAVADAARPATVRALVGRGDVLVSTVGPFAWYGEPAVEAAVAEGAWYLDSTGEPRFIRRVFENGGPRAAASGAGLVPAFGYDYVAGNLAATLALREAGEPAERVDVGYFTVGAGLGTLRGAASRGTRMSAAGIAVEPAYDWSNGLRDQRLGSRVRTFRVLGRNRPALSIGASEHFALPRLHPGLREVNVYLGVPSGGVRAVRTAAGVAPLLAGIPGVRSGLRRVGDRAMRRPARQPDPDAEVRVGAYVVALARDSHGRQLGEVRLAGGNPYRFTARLLAWGASVAAGGGMRATGALGPVEAFGLRELEEACAEAGLTRSSGGGPHAPDHVSGSR